MACFYVEQSDDFRPVIAAAIDHVSHAESAFGPKGVDTRRKNSELKAEY